MTSIHSANASAASRGLRRGPPGARPPTGVIVPVWQRILVLTAVIWHNDKINVPVERPPITYDY